MGSVSFNPYSVLPVADDTDSDTNIADEPVNHTQTSQHDKAKEIAYAQTPIIANSKSCREAEEHFRDVKKPDVYHYNALLHVYAFYLPRHAYSVISRMKKNKVDRNINTYNILIHAYVQLNNMHSALHVLYQLIPQEQLKADLTTFNTLLKLCAINKDGKQALKIYQNQILQNYRLTPNIITLNTLIRALGNGQPEKAYEIFEGEMTKYNISPDDVTLNTLVKIFVKTHLFRAIAIYKVIPAIPDSFTMSMLLNQCIQQNQISHANALYMDLCVRQISIDEHLALPLIELDVINAQIPHAEVLFHLFYTLGCTKMDGLDVIDCTRFGPGFAYIQVSVYLKINTKKPFYLNFGRDNKKRDKFLETLSLYHSDQLEWEITNNKVRVKHKN